MTTPAVESLPRRNSDPIWLQDYFVHTGHDADTRSGTSTFVKRKGQPTHNRRGRSGFDAQRCPAYDYLK
jgi:hypothetical protein